MASLRPSPEPGCTGAARLSVRSENRRSVIPAWFVRARFCRHPLFQTQSSVRGSRHSYERNSRDTLTHRSSNDPTVTFSLNRRFERPPVRSPAVLSQPVCHWFVSGPNPMKSRRRPVRETSLSPSSAIDQWWSTCGSVGYLSARYASAATTFVSTPPADIACVLHLAADCSQSRRPQSSVPCRSGTQPLNPEKINEIFWPPNPKLFERACRTGTSRAAFGT